MNGTMASKDARRFRFLECIGTGGFGEVYLAEMSSASGVTSKVAVKLLLSSVDPKSSPVERLRDEGKMLGLLDHPVILRVTDLVELDGRVALVTQYVDGCDLLACFKGTNTIPAGPLLEVIGLVADALGHAYTTQGPSGLPLQLVHRDIKPTNIRIGRHGEVKLLDFGIARTNEADREARTTLGAVIGTREYMAPERFDDDAPPSPAGDIFALGCTLYDGLAKRRLFKNVKTNVHFALASDRAKFDSFVGDRLQALDTDEDIRSLLHGMLQFDAADRPDAADVRARCERLARSREPTLRVWTRDWTWPERAQLASPLSGRILTEGGTSSPSTLASRPSAGPSTVNPASGTLRPVALAAAGVASVTGLVGLAAVVAVGIAVGGWYWTQSPVPEPPPPAAPAAAAPATAPARVAVVAAAEPVAAPPPALPAVAPAPAPKAAAAPSPVAPTPAPAPVPAPVATPTQYRGAEVPVELRGASGSHPPGTIDPGKYEIWADFGQGLVSAGSTTIPDGGAVQIKCSRLKNTCSGSVQ